MVKPYLALLAIVAVQRIAELHLSRRHAEWTRARGGREFGARHFSWMKLLHVGFLAGAALEVVGLERPFIPGLGYPMLAVFLAAQALRYWAIASLGPFWNVRVIVVPGAPRVDRGPYRYVRHPNYAAVVVEFLSLPLIHTAWLTAVTFSALNAIMLTIRIRCEERALSLHAAR